MCLSNLTQAAVALQVFSLILYCIVALAYNLLHSVCDIWALIAIVISTSLLVTPGQLSQISSCVFVNQLLNLNITHDVLMSLHWL